MMLVKVDSTTRLAVFTSTSSNSNNAKFTQQKEAIGGTGTSTASATGFQADIP